MPRAGDSYVVALKKAHLEWGSHRHTFSRPGIIYGEGYIKIPAPIAYDYEIYNSNNPYGANIYYDCSSYDGLYSGVLLAQGNQSNPVFAKQFSEYDDLKAIGYWYYQVNAAVGDFVKLVFTSPSDIIIEHSTTRSGFNI
jgi:hypothetical protein